LAGKGSLKKKIMAVLLVLCLIAGVAGYVFYRAFYYPGIRFSEKSKLIYIHTGWNFDQVEEMLETKHILRSPAGFKLLAGLKKYKTDVKPGRYRVMSGMSNAQLINLLASGKQEPESISLFNIRVKKDLIDILIAKMEADSSVINQSFSDAAIKKYGFTSTTILAMFIPGTYQMLWTDTPESFLDEMHKNYEDFWTAERRKQAAAIPLSPLQVSVLASIVQAEQSVFEDEKPVIAGLYINRLKKDIPLQSDPTLIYARGDFSIMRVRNGDKEINSPYNTYMHAGLPPGPINMPTTSSLDAVLHYQKNDYIYMCAECDFSGRTHFCTTLKEQEEYASKYQKALNKRDIVR
jgi:UPF0755 protein